VRRASRADPVAAPGCISNFPSGAQHGRDCSTMRAGWRTLAEATEAATDDRLFSPAAGCLSRSPARIVLVEPFPFEIPKRLCLPRLARQGTDRAGHHPMAPFTPCHATNAPLRPGLR